MEMCNSWDCMIYFTFSISFVVVEKTYYRNLCCTFSPRTCLTVPFSAYIHKWSCVYSALAATLSSYWLYFEFFVGIHTKRVVFVFNWMHIFMHTSQSVFILYMSSILQQKTLHSVGCFRNSGKILFSLSFCLCAPRKFDYFLPLGMVTLSFFFAIASNVVISHESNTILYHFSIGKQQKIFTTFPSLVFYNLLFFICHFFLVTRRCHKACKARKWDREGEVDGEKIVDFTTW